MNGIKLFAIFAAALWLTGCAALTIDVDVYKGPMSNHKDVQTEQLAVMAIGAKPLLMQLRNRLEESKIVSWKSEPGKIPLPQKCEKTLKKFQKHPNYRNKYIRETEYFFCDNDASRVNVVLSLYEDRRSVDDLGAFAYPIQKIESALKEIQHAKPVLFAENKEEQERKWDGFEDAFRTDSEIKELITVEGGGNQEVDLASAVEDLKSAYKKFFIAEEDSKYKMKIRNIKAVFDEHWKLVKLMKTLNPEWAKGLNEGRLPENCSNKEDLKCPKPSVTSRFFALAENKNGVVDAQAKILFSDKKKFEAKKTEFVQSVIKAARSFSPMREAIRASMRGTLEIIDLLGKKENAEFKRRYLLEVVEIAMSWIRLDYFWRSLDLFSSSTDPITQNFLSAKNDIKGFLGNTITPKDIKKNRENNKTKLQKELRKRLIHDPSRYVQFLLHADSLFAESATAQNRIPTFGIAKGPVTFANEFGPQKIIKSLSKIVTFFGGGFGKGRLNAGLETLTENYLRTANETVPGNPRRISGEACPSLGKVCSQKKIETERARLTDALVRYAEKVLFIANNHVMLVPPGEGNDKSYLEIARYTRVLQAVGNSILFQVDELRHQSDFARKQEDGGKREAHALAQSLPKSSEQVLDHLLAYLSKDVAVGAPLLKKFQSETKAAEFVAEKKSAQEEAQSAYDGKESEIKTTVTKINNLNRTVKFLKNEVELISIPPVGSDESWKLAIRLFNGAGTAEVKDIASNISEQNLVDHIRTGLGNIRRKIEEGATDLPEKSKQIQGIEIILDPSKNAFSGDETSGEVDGKPVVVAYASIKVKLRENRSRELNNLDQKNKELTALNLALKKAKEIHAGAIDQEKLYLKTVRQQNALTEIQGHRLGIIQELYAKNLQNNPKAVKGTLLAALEKTKGEVNTAGANDKAQRLKKLEDAKKLVTGWPPPIDYPLLKQPGQTKLTTNQVMDQLIATLKYEHIQAVQEGGTESQMAKNYQAAMKAAYDHRAGMVAIRPAMAFLRSSTPSTTLQRDASLNWNNMLRKNALRGFFSALFIDPEHYDDKLKKQNRRISAEIDKQYWHNINRVNVSGGGNTNYVIAKDDVGNWYVKNYSADPKDIIKSAKNLALFGMGPGLGGVDLVNPSLARDDRGETGTAQTPSDPNDPTQRNQTLLARQFEKFHKNYKDSTDKDLKGIKTLVNGLEESIQSSWQSDPTLNTEETLSALAKAKSNTHKLLEEAKKEESVSNQESNEEKALRESKRGDKIVGILQGLKQYSTALDREIKKQIISDKETKALVTSKQNAEQANAEFIAAGHEKDNARINLFEAKENPDPDGGNVTKATRELEVKNQNLNKKQEEFRKISAEYEKDKKAYERARFISDTARERMFTVVRQQITKFLDGRVKTVANYGTAVKILNQSITP